MPSMNIHLIKCTFLSLIREGEGGGVEGEEGGRGGEVEGRGHTKGTQRETVMSLIREGEG